jgi:hypothetical protein
VCGCGSQWSPSAGLRSCRDDTILLLVLITQHQASLDCCSMRVLAMLIDWRKRGLGWLAMVVM